LPLNSILSAWPLLLGMGVLMLGAGLQSTLLGVRATLEGFPTPVIGIVMSCYYVGYLLGTLAAPPLLRKVGHVRVFAAFAAVAAASALFQAVIVTPWAWGSMRLLTGLCFAGIYVVAESWLNDRAQRGSRARLMAAYMVALYLGLGAGQYLLLASDPAGTQPFMFVSGLISLALVPIVLSTQPTPTVVAPRQVRFGELYHDSPFGVVGVAVAGVLTSIIFSIGPVYARLRGLDNTGIATYMACCILGGVVSQYPVGLLADRIDRRAVIAGVCAVACAVAAAIAVFDALPLPLFVALAALFSGLVLTVYSLSVSHVNDRLEPAQMVAASSALLLLNGAAAIVGPMLASGTMGIYGPRAYYAVLAMLAGLLTIYGVWRKLRRKPVPPEHKIHSIGTQPPR
jgi:MFS family permease